MLAATPGQSPGTTIQPWCWELYDIIGHHTITMFSFAINNHLYVSIVPPQTLPMPALPSNLDWKREEDTFTSLTAGVFVLWERQRVCTAGGSLEVLPGGVHSVEDVGRARQDRRHKPC